MEKEIHSYSIELIQKISLERLKYRSPTAYEVELAFPASRYFSRDLEVDIKGQNFRYLKWPFINTRVSGFLERIFKNVEQVPGSKIFYILKTNRTYSVVVLANKVVFSRKGYGPIQFVLSKHVNLAEWSPVKFSGELQIDSAGTIHIFNRSGTYRAGNYTLLPAKEFFEALFDGRKVVVHPKPIKVRKTVNLKSFQEMETKLSIPDLPTFEQIRQLNGQTITLLDANNRALKYKIKAWGLWKNSDIYFDTGDFDLYLNQGCLRRRIWYSLKDPSKIWIVELQAKGGPQAPVDGSTSYRFRDEVRGKSFSSLEAWEKWKMRAFQFPSVDKAVIYCREFATHDKDLNPVLSLEGERYNLFAYKISKNPFDKIIPQLLLSVDKIRFGSSSGQPVQEKYLELEIELLDFLPFGLNKITNNRVREAKVLEQFLMNTFGLSFVTRSKYAIGLHQTFPSLGNAWPGVKDSVNVEDFNYGTVVK